MSKQSFDEGLREIITEITVDHDSDTLEPVMLSYVNKLKHLIREHMPEKREGVQEYTSTEGEDYYTCMYCGGYDECDCSGFNEALDDVEKGFGL